MLETALFLSPFSALGIDGRGGGVVMEPPLKLFETDPLLKKKPDPPRPPLAAKGGRRPPAAENLLYKAPLGGVLGGP